MRTSIFSISGNKKKYDLIKENWATEESERYYLNQDTFEKYDQIKEELDKHDLQSRFYGLFQQRANFHLKTNDCTIDGVLCVCQHLF